ncbi:MAG: pyridoxal 5'-phosphate synthase glutaminase subunit PdxT [Armatimonadetes bacterium]|nr:pyridoxal 5'-phosphate synthase glutaminase subunit PdxT [Armatimonadota bacterium]
MGVEAGVVAVQGDFDRHTKALLSAGATSVREIRTPEDLQGLDHVVIPGGESTTVGMLMERFGLRSALQTYAAEGHALWGTCMGMILMAKETEGREQLLLEVLDVTVKRNVFGAQVHSFEDDVPVTFLDGSVTGVFIRAPIVVRQGPGVETVATYKSDIVGVRQGRLLGTSFHPELTDDDRLHRWFLEN